MHNQQTGGCLFGVPLNQPQIRIPSTKTHPFLAKEIKGHHLLLWSELGGPGKEASSKNKYTVFELQQPHASSRQNIKGLYGRIGSVLFEGTLCGLALRKAKRITIHYSTFHFHSFEGSESFQEIIQNPGKTTVFLKRTMVAKRGNQRTNERWFLERTNGLNTMD